MAVTARRQAMYDGMGYRQHHWLRPTLIIIPGIGLLSAGAFAVPPDSKETALTGSGVLSLAVGHVANWRAMRHRQLPATRGPGI